MQVEKTRHAGFLGKTKRPEWERGRELNIMFALQDIAILRV